MSESNQKEKDVFDEALDLFKPEEEKKEEIKKYDTFVHGYINGIPVVIQILLNLPPSFIEELVTLLEKSIAKERLMNYLEVVKYVEIIRAVKFTRVFKFITPVIINQFPTFKTCFTLIPAPLFLHPDHTIRMCLFLKQSALLFEPVTIDGIPEGTYSRAFPALVEELAQTKQELVELRLKIEKETANKR